MTTLSLRAIPRGLLQALLTAAVILAAPGRAWAPDDLARDQSPEEESVGTPEAAEVLRGASLPWWTVDGGGEVSSGGSFALSATVAQPDAGPTAGSGFSFAGGFWADEAAPQEPLVFADGFETGDTSRWSS